MKVENLRPFIALLNFLNHQESYFLFMKYYLWINEAQEGPFEDWEILQKVLDQNINLDTLAYEEGGSNPSWIKVSEIPAICWTESKMPPAPQPSNERWYYINDQQRVAGPARAEGLKVLAGINEISKETLICSEGSDTWIPYAQVFPQTQKSTIATSPTRKKNAENPFFAIFFALVVGMAVLIFINSTSSTSGTSIKRNKSNATVAEGEALLEEMEKYNANPRRTQAERKDIERRMQDYENRVYSK